MNDNENDLSKFIPEFYFIRPQKKPSTPVTSSMWLFTHRMSCLSIESFPNFLFSNFPDYPHLNFKYTHSAIDVFSFLISNMSFHHMM